MDFKLLINLSLVLLLLGLPSRSFAGRDLNLVATNYPPFYADSLPEQGGVAQVVKEAFKRQGYNASVKFYPFARAALLVKPAKPMVLLDFGTAKNVSNGRIILHRYKPYRLSSTNVKITRYVLVN